jgi:hypothetical protein
MEIKLNRFKDPRGNLSVFEDKNFEIRRVVLIVNLRSDETRAGFSLIHGNQRIFCLSGAVKVRYSTGRDEFKEIILNRPDEGLIVPSGVWVELLGVSSGASVLSIHDTDYSESDYVRDYTDFQNLWRV